MEKHSFALIKRRDAILLAVITAAGLLVMFAVYITRLTGDFADVRVDGSTVCRLPLSVDTVYTIEGYDGGTNALVIENGSAYVREASCPDGLCAGMGAVRYRGQSIICLPNRVVIEITGGQSDDADDAFETDIITGGRP